MNINKVAIVGAGTNGATIAEQAALTAAVDDILLIDSRDKKAKAEAADLTHMMAFQDRVCRIHPGTCDQCKDVDIVVITVNAPQIEGQPVEEMVENAKSIVKPYVTDIMNSGFNGYFVVNTKPVDVMSYYVWKLSGLPSNHIIGTGCILHTARLKTFIADRYDVRPSNITAYTMGVHTYAEFIPWSATSIFGKSMVDIIADNPKMSNGFDKEEVTAETVQIGRDIADIKMTSNFGIASETVQILDAIFRNENTILPVSTNVDGHYGLGECFLSVPAVINMNGVHDILDLHLTDEEMAKMKKAADFVMKLNS